MARYTKLDKQAIMEIAADYGLYVDGFAAIEGGAGNSSYHLMTRQGEYVLTVFDDKTYTHASQTGILLQQMEKHNIPSSILLPTLNREPVTTFCGKPVMLKKFIQGVVCPALNLVQLQQVGHVMAELHAVPPSRQMENEHSYGLQMFSTITGKGSSPDYEEWLIEKEKYISAQIPDGLPRGFTHGDLFYDNVLFDKKELRAIIDFEEACIYYLVFDIGMAIVGLCSTANGMDLQKARALLQGYQRVRFLEPNERAVIQLFAVYAATATSYWRYWKFNIHMPDQIMRNHYRKMMRLADSIQQLCGEYFYQEIFEGK